MIHMSNCDDCTVNLPFDLALELTKIYYGGESNNNYRYKDDVIDIYNYFKKELNKGEEIANEED